MPASPFTSRPWQSREDTRSLQELVSARLALDWPAVRFHPGDVDWWVVHAYGRVPGMPERVRLWFDDRDALLAYGWFSPPGDLDFLIATRDAAQVAALVVELVDWADERRVTFADGGAGALRSWASAADGTAIAALEALGLVREDRPGFVQFTGGLAIAETWPEPALSPGLTIRPLETDADVEARVACGRAAFTGSTMTAERYRTTFDALLYRRSLDLHVLTPDGRVVAFALGWYDPATRVVELEPVGVHPDWQRRGLGAEICRATLRAARALGAERAMIAADRANPGALALYASLGLTITADIVPYVRPIAPPSGADSPA